MILVTRYTLILSFGLRTKTRNNDLLAHHQKAHLHTPPCHTLHPGHLQHRKDWPEIFLEQPLFKAGLSCAHWYSLMAAPPSSWTLTILVPCPSKRRQHHRRVWEKPPNMLLLRGTNKAKESKSKESKAKNTSPSLPVPMPMTGTEKVDITYGNDLWPWFMTVSSAKALWSIFVTMSYALWSYLMTHYLWLMT